MSLIQNALHHIAYGMKTIFNAILNNSLILVNERSGHMPINYIDNATTGMHKHNGIYYDSLVNFMLYSDNNSGSIAHSAKSNKNTAYNENPISLIKIYNKNTNLYDLQNIIYGFNNNASMPKKFLQLDKIAQIEFRAYPKNIQRRLYCYFSHTVCKSRKIFIGEFLPKFYKVQKHIGRKSRCRHFYGLSTFIYLLLNC